VKLCDKVQDLAQILLGFGALIILFNIQSLQLAKDGSLKLEISEDEIPYFED
jgi:hypothetical protein